MRCLPAYFTFMIHERCREGPMESPRSTSAEPEPLVKRGRDCGECACEHLAYAHVRVIRCGTDRTHNFDFASATRLCLELSVRKRVADELIERRGEKLPAGSEERFSRSNSPERRVNWYALAFEQRRVDLFQVDLRPGVGDGSVHFTCDEGDVGSATGVSIYLATLNR
jgi:hypothetical protein